MRFFGQQFVKPSGSLIHPIVWPETVRWIKLPLGIEVGLSIGHTVLDWDPAPPFLLPPKRGTATPFNLLVHVYCGQTAGWIKMPLGTEVDIGPGDTVLDGDPAPLP